MPFFWTRTDISDEQLTAEFEFWKSHFLYSVAAATACAATGGLLIAACPQDVGSAQLRDFARQLWPAFVEVAFWFGFLIGLLWAASRRMGSGLAGTVPWSRNKTPAAAIFGQAGCGLFFGAGLLWVAMHFVRQLGEGAVDLLHTLAQLVNAGFVTSGICILIAIAGRLRLYGK